MPDLTLRAVRIEDVEPGRLCLARNQAGTYKTGIVGAIYPDAHRAFCCFDTSEQWTSAELAGLWLLEEAEEGSD